MSPFLFVLCTESLSHLLDIAERNGLLQRMRFSGTGPSIHHLFFADDSMFLVKASAEQCRNLNCILQFYGEATSQTINYQKSAITFGTLVEEEERVAIKDILKIYNN